MAKEETITLTDKLDQDWRNVKNLISLKVNPKLEILLPLFNPLHSNVIMHILHTVLYIFPKVLTRRMCLLVKSFFCWASFPSFS